MRHYLLFLNSLTGDEVTSFSKLKEFQSHLPMAMTEPFVAQERLTVIQVIKVF